MKLVVGYNGTEASKRALELARRQADGSDALVYVVTSMKKEGDGNDTKALEIETELQWAKDRLLKSRIQCETLSLYRGMSPGEDLVKFALDNGVEMVFLGVEKKSVTRKLLLGSTVQYVILKGPCPVTTTK